MKIAGIRLEILGVIGLMEILNFLEERFSGKNLRGHRIELGEIEAAMNKYPGVKKSVAAAVGDVQGNKYLAGYIIPENRVPGKLF